MLIFLFLSGHGVSVLVWFCLLFVLGPKRSYLASLTNLVNLFLDFKYFLPFNVKTMSQLLANTFATGRSLSLPGVAKLFVGRSHGCHPIGIKAFLWEPVSCKIMDSQQYLQLIWSY